MIPKTLALDFGERKVGLALSYGTLAEPLQVLPNDEFLLDQLGAICEEHQVEQLVVGISESTSAELSKEFAERLTSLALPVYFADETLSTQKAQELITQIKGKAYRGQDDHFAAAVFLQEWIDTHH